jgi:MCP family monocarboxylic acid transporter-like MFS transporter 10
MIVILGTSIGGPFLPLLLPVLVKRWGIASTLRVLFIAILVILVVSLPFLRGRLPITRVRARAPRSADRSYLRTALFWIFVVTNLMQALAFFVPILWLPCQYLLLFPCRDGGLNLPCSIRSLIAPQRYTVAVGFNYAER